MLPLAEHLRGALGPRALAGDLKGVVARIRKPRTRFETGADFRGAVWSQYLESRDRSGRRSLYQGPAARERWDGATMSVSARTATWNNPEPENRVWYATGRACRGAPLSATTSTCETSRAVRRFCSEKKKKKRKGTNNASCAIGPLCSAVSTYISRSTRYATPSCDSTSPGPTDSIYGAESSMSLISRDPFGSRQGRLRGRPSSISGWVLRCFLGTMYAPNSGSRRAGRVDITHKSGRPRAGEHRHVGHSGK